MKSYSNCKKQITKWSSENRLAKMWKKCWKCLTSFSFFSGALCVLSGGRLPEALFMVILLDSKGAKMCKSCRSREELSNEYLLSKFGVDTPENGPKVCQKLEENREIIGRTPTPGLRGLTTTMTSAPWPPGTRWAESTWSAGRTAQANTTAPRAPFRPAPGARTTPSRSTATWTWTVLS